MFSVVKVPYCELATHNVVWMSSQDLQTLFPNRQIQEPRWLSIANLFYQAWPLDGIEKGCIGLNGPMSSDIRKATFFLNDLEQVFLTAFPNTPPSLPDIEKISFEIIRDPDSESWHGAGSVNLDLLHLTQNVQRLLQNNAICRNQSFFLHTDQGNFKLSAKQMSCSKQIQGPLLFGKLTGKTHIEFIAERLSNIYIVENIVEQNIECFIFNVCLTRNLLIKNALPKPLQIDLSELRSEIAKQLMNQKVVVGHKFFKKDTNGWVFHYELFQVKQLQKERFENSYYQSAFELKENSKIQFCWEKEDLVITTGSEEFCKEIHFKIIEHSNSADDKEKAQLKKPWMSQSELEDTIRSVKKPFAENEALLLKLSQGEFVVHITSITAKDNKPEDPNETCKKLYQIAPDTKITTSCSEALKMRLIDSLTPYELESVKIEVKTKTQFFFESDKITLLNEEDLQSVFFRTFKKLIVRKMSEVVTVGDEENIKLSVSCMECKNEDEIQYKHGILGLITEKTKIQFVPAEKCKVRIVTKQQALQIKDPIKELEQMGVGGLCAQMQEIVRNIFLARGPMRKQMLRRGLEPQRGILFWGPPGTGKTTFARNLSKMLGALGENVQMITAPQVFNKFVGESEKNIRELFKPAREAQEKLKSKSPLYVVIIDEIDAILSTRSDDTNQWRNSVVNQFLSEIDGPNKLNNILIIGMTNRKDQLDPAAIRPGRLELLIEIGLPNSEARKQIFEIHLKKVKEEGLFANNVAIDSLIGPTDGWSGADIEGVVKRAINYSIERLNLLSLPDEEVNKHPDGLLRQEDLQKAISDVKAIKKDDKSKIPEGMYG
jgi:ATP-dependent 26S proteasome regulatory subunit